MKLVFTFTDHPTLVNVSKDDLYNTSLEVPDEALYLIGCRERVLVIGQFVSQLTNSSLYLSCKELDLKNHSIKEADADPAHQLQLMTRASILCFERLYNRATHKRQLKIWSP